MRAERRPVLLDTKTLMLEIRTRWRLPILTVSSCPESISSYTVVRPTPSERPASLMDAHSASIGTSNLSGAKMRRCPGMCIGE